MSQRLLRAISGCACAFLALAVSGCVGSDLTSYDGAGDSVNNGRPDPAASPVDDRPLTEFLSLLTGAGLSQQENQRRQDARTLRIQEIVAQCMTDQGFEYAINLSWGMQVPQTDWTLWREDDRDWVAQWGYGSVLAPTENPNMWTMTMSGDDDPNTEIRARLSPAEERAWQTAFFGGPDYMENPGCWALGQRQANEETPDGIARGSEQFVPLMEALDEFWASLAPEVPPEHERDWSFCMADAGHPGFETRNEVSWQLWTEINDARDPDSDAVMWDPVAAANEGDLSTEMEAVRQREIELALADFDCRVEVDFDAREAARIHDAEAQFVADHRADLEALRDAVAQHQATN